MSDSDKPPSLEELGTRIAKVRHQAGLDDEDKGRGEPPPSGELGMAWRISIEIVVALIICTGLGWVFDHWFGTTPWVMLVGLFLGGAAGVRNAVRTMNRMDQLAQERDKAEGDRAPKRGE